MPLEPNEVECTCDLMAHPCEIHDTTGSPDVVRGSDWTNGKGMFSTPEEETENARYIQELEEAAEKMNEAERLHHNRTVERRWLRALMEGKCMACPEGCVSCLGPQDCECYEHQENGPNDDQLRELLKEKGKL